MAAGGFKTFVAGEILTSADTNDFLMQGVLVFADATARDAAITSPVEGQFAFLTTDDELTFYDGSDWVEFETGPLLADFLVIAGGGGGGTGNNSSSNRAGGGGGAGGYRTSAGTSGNNQPAESKFIITPGVALPLTVGAGGAGGSGAGSIGSSGTNSFFGTISALRGGGGMRNGAGLSGLPGGSAGGDGALAGSVAIERIGVVSQGFGGGTSNPGSNVGGGGGGAGEVGQNSGEFGGSGGDGLASTITGTSVFRGGGGGGADSSSSASGGDGGGGNPNGGAGDANTGGGGAGDPFTAAGNGGSGVVIFAVPTGTSVTFSGGVTETDSVVGENDVYVVTAAGPNDTVTIG